MKPKQINYYSISGAARQLGINESTVRQRMGSGVMPHVTTLDGVRLIPAQAVESAVDPPMGRRPRGRKPVS